MDGASPWSGICLLLTRKVRLESVPATLSAMGSAMTMPSLSAMPWAGFRLSRSCGSPVMTHPSILKTSRKSRQLSLRMLRSMPPNPVSASVVVSATMWRGVGRSMTTCTSHESSKISFVSSSTDRRRDVEKMGLSSWTSVSPGDRMTTPMPLPRHWARMAAMRNI